MDFSSCDAILQARGVFLFYLFIVNAPDYGRENRSETQKSHFFENFGFFHPFERKHTAERLFKFVKKTIFGVPSLEILKNP